MLSSNIIRYFEVPYRIKALLNAFPNQYAQWLLKTFAKRVFLVELLVGMMVIGLPGCTTTSPSTSKVVVKAEPRSAYGNPESYVVFGKRYFPLPSSRGFYQHGIASWYGKKFHGRKTSSQETYNMYAMTAAHKELPLPTYVEVHNLENGRKQIVRVNDRGPFHGDRIIDLSYVAAKALKMIKRGTAMVEIHTIAPGFSASSHDHSRVSESHESGSYLQVGAFISYRNALALQQKLSAITTQTVFISRLAGKGLYRVRIEVDGDRGNLDKLISSIAHLGFDQPYFISN